MRLGEFILTEMEQILVEWEAFAKTLYPEEARMNSAGLRDHAKEILQAIAEDLHTEQTAERQAQKSKGLVFPPPDAPESAAQTHGDLRAISGLDINQLASEYRALRASVLRLWNEDLRLDRHSLQDVIRFNEAIDQALAESIAFFSEQFSRSRNLVLGMLGHDMRSPLNAIALIGENLAGMDMGEEASEFALTLINSSRALKALLDDLVDFSRKNLGLGININVGAVDLGALCTAELSLHRAAFPDSKIELAMEGNLHGRWDGQRLQQVLRNLLSNACDYGTAGEPVRVVVRGEEDAVCIEVRNIGPTIEEGNAQQVFEPLWRGFLPENRSNRHGVGLGLYIVREITRAHGGDVKMQSNGNETIFSVHLPRVSECSGAVIKMG